MKFQFRGVWYKFDTFYGVNLDVLSDEFYRYRAKYNRSSPAFLSELSEYSALTKVLNAEEENFLRCCAFGVHMIDSIPRRQLKRILDSYPDIETVFHVPNHKFQKVQKAIRIDLYKVEYLLSFMDKDFAKCVFKLFDYYIKKEGKSKELEAFKRKEYEKYVKDYWDYYTKKIRN